MGNNGMNNSGQNNLNMGGNMGNQGGGDIMMGQIRGAGPLPMGQGLGTGQTGNYDLHAGEGAGHGKLVNEILREKDEMLQRQQMEQLQQGQMMSQVEGDDGTRDPNLPAN